MAYIGPWSNFHELNLDWVLEQLKQLRKDVDDISGYTNPYELSPEMDGVASPGDSNSSSRGNHVHPTDTSRAAADDLTQEITDRGDADIALAGDIAAVDAKIKLANTAPIMDDSSATAGTSDFMSRADHVHPTDTSRASKSEFDSLKAVVDGMAGSANPYDSAPEMDGLASAGVIGAYARGDHVHPADTSKLDVAGGEITGDLQIDGVLTQELRRGQDTLSSSGWYRVITFPAIPGAKAIINIVRNSNSTPEETHKIVAVYKTSGLAFSHEESIVDTMLIDKIRYTDAGAIDIHYDQNYTNTVSIDIEVFTPSKTDLDDIHVNTFTAVDAAPVGEVIGEVYSFRNSEGWSAVEAQTGTTPIVLPITWKELYVDARFGTNPAYGFTFFVVHAAMAGPSQRYLQGSYSSATDAHSMNILVSDTAVSLESWIFRGSDVVSTSSIRVCYR